MSDYKFDQNDIDASFDAGYSHAIEELKPLLSSVLDKIMWLDDEGPSDEGWQSDKLCGIINQLRKLVE